MLDVSKWVVLVVYRENKKRRSAAAVCRQRSFSVLLLEVGMNLEIRHCKIESTAQNHHFVLNDCDCSRDTVPHKIVVWSLDFCLTTCRRREPWGRTCQQQPSPRRWACTSPQPCRKGRGLLRPRPGRRRQTRGGSWETGSCRLCGRAGVSLAGAT